MPKFTECRENALFSIWHLNDIVSDKCKKNEIFHDMSIRYMVSMEFVIANEDWF